MRQSILIILTLLAVILRAQDANSSGPAYVYESWRTDNGLPNNDIRSVLQTRDGYVWVATVKGLARFDGATFRFFNSVNTPEMSGDIISNLCEDKDGRIWFGVDFGGLVWYKDGVFSVKDVPPELRYSLIRKTFLDDRGRFWVGSTEGLYVSDGGPLTKVKSFQGVVNDICQDRPGRILLASSSLYIVTDEGVKKAILVGESPKSIGRIGIGTDGTLMIGGDELIYKVTVNPNNLRWKSRKYDYRRRVTMFYEESPGVFLLTSYGYGVERLERGLLTPVRGLERLQGAFLNSRQIAAGQEKEIWIATGGGLLRLRRSFTWTIGKAEGIPDNHVWSVTRVRDGSIWVGTEAGPTVNLQHGTVRTILKKRDGMPSELITAVREMSDGSTWFGGNPGGLVRMSGRTYQDLSHESGYPGGSPRAILEDHQQRVWVGTTNGLTCYDGTKFTQFPEFTAQANRRVNSIQEDTNGDIWVCAGSIFRVRGDSLRAFRGAGTAGKFSAWSMYADTGRVWFGSYGSGLHLIQGDSVISFERYSMELGPNILSIMEDAKGKLWINAEHELQSISKQELLDAVAGKKTRIDPRVYGPLDGLNDIEFNGAGMHSSSRGDDGTILYASMNGLVVVAPTLVPTSSHAPPVRIEHLVVDGREVPYAEPVEIPAGTKSIDIGFSALTFESIPKVKMRYRLDGIDEDWRDLPFLRRSISFANIDHGTYRFRVIAANAEGIWNHEGASLSFTVLPYFYETKLFTLLSSLLVISLIIAGYRWRTATLHARQEFLQKIVYEKTGALKEEIEIRKGTEEELRIIQSNLEQRVEERTMQLSSAMEDLRRSREQYQKIVDTAQEGIWMTDAGNVTVFANPKMAEILGCPVESLIGSDILVFLDESSKAALAETRKRHRDGLGARYELEFIRPDGSRVSTVISATPILDEGGEYQGSLAMVADVSDQKKTEREHRRVEEELRQVQKMEAVGQLAGGIAHDFNNLLIPILGYAEMLQKELAAKEVPLKRITTIRRAAEKAALLTKQLLSFSRRQVMESRVMNLNRIIADFSPILQRTIREDVEIRYELSDDLCNMRGDASQIDQILINLLVNAQDAMADGGVVTVETTNASVSPGETGAYGALKPGNYAALVVTDSGKGIPAEVVDHIFEPFFTTKDKSKGTGLGLATVYGIIKQHNGHIWVDSTVGVGTSFTIYFPAAEASLPAKSDTVPAQETMLTGTATIVVMEDDDLVRQFAHTILDESGYNVQEFATVDKCLKFFRESGIHVDLMLTDVVMPVMNGRELYATLAREFPDLKVVYMSGYSDEVISHSGILEEGVALIQKPFTAETLLKRIQKALARS
ncbi:MAG: ATP-binding protein [Ignavibacteriales bacterium]|nr:ATP-binding protein [Ignavibacteriales bacterium]